MKKTKIGVFALVTVLMLSLSAVPTAFSYEFTDHVLPTYDSQEDIGGYKWLFWNDSSDSAAIILFGGYQHSTYVEIRHLDDDDPPHPEFSLPKYNFIVELHANGLDILTPNEHINYSTESIWLTDVADWLQDRNYQNIYLFGWSAGGVAVGYEIQRPNADQFYTAAFIASAPVDNDNYDDELWHTADTAANTKVRTGFLCHPEDEHGCYPQMQTYYNNTPSNIPKEWHDWGGEEEYSHDIFPHHCLTHPGETLSEAVYDWFNYVPPSPPNVPELTGPWLWYGGDPVLQSVTYRNTEYIFAAYTSDPDGDDVRFKFYWGDGTTTTTGWYSGEAYSLETHSWSSVGTYTVKVRAYDPGGLWSESQPLTVNIVSYSTWTCDYCGATFPYEPDYCPYCCNSYTIFYVYRCSKCGQIEISEYYYPAVPHWGCGGAFYCVGGYYECNYCGKQYSPWHGWPGCYHSSFTPS